jgi:3-hydroxyacyl-[acyl-carrier-protein] dehydratase
VTAPQTDAAERRIDWSWLDRVTAIDADDRALHAQRDILATEWYFRFHFPGLPIVPGVLLVEAMAHAAGVLQVVRRHRLDGRFTHYILAGIEGARFYRSARPGDRVELHARHVSSDDDAEAILRTSAKVGATRIARCDVLLHALDPGAAAGELDRSLAHSLDRVLAPELRARYAPAGWT